MSRNGGFVKIRHGLREHLRDMSDRAVKLYLLLHLSAGWQGRHRGIVSTSYDELRERLGWKLRRTVERAMAELKLHYVEIVQKGNDRQPTLIRILRYDGSGADSAYDFKVGSDKSAPDSAPDSGADFKVGSDPRKPTKIREMHAPKTLDVRSKIEATPPLPPSLPRVGNDHGHGAPPNNFPIKCCDGSIVEVFVPIGRKIFRNDRERGRFDSYTGNDDIRCPYPDRVEEFFKEKGFRVSRIAPQERAAVK